MHRISTALYATMLAIVWSPSTNANKLYKVVDENGKVTYTDQAPTQSNVKTTTLKIQEAPATPLPESVLKYQAELRKGMQQRLEDANKPRLGSVTLFSASWCGYCTQAKSFLSSQQIAFTEIDIDTPEGAKAFVGAGGGKGVPLLVTSDGRRQSGFSKESYAALLGKKLK
jgi:glutaredoxin